MTDMATRPADHPNAPRGRVGLVLLNLGTPDATDYWSMRRYLNEFLSDRRVIDYPRLLWQPLLQLVILSKRPFSSGEAYRSIWNDERDECPLRTVTRNQAEKVAALDRFFVNSVGIHRHVREDANSLLGNFDQTFADGEVDILHGEEAAEILADATRFENGRHVVRPRSERIA